MFKKAFKRLSRLASGRQVKAKKSARHSVKSPPTYERVLTAEGWKRLKDRKKINGM